MGAMATDQEAHTRQHGERASPARQGSRELPSGTVSFLLTDIEGSTRMWRTNPEAMLGAVTRHRELIHRSVERHGGALPKDQGEGDSVLAAFERATDAVAAALAFQTALAEEQWPEGAPVRVRAAVHTGEAEIRDNNYYGTSLSRAARIRALAWGGQTLMSQTTYQLVKDYLPDDCIARHLGAYSLKDFEDQEHLYQLSGGVLQSDFPPLQVREAKPHNLPVLLTKFVGREREISDVKELLRSARLVTLTGAGGSGKSRLAIEVAREVMDGFEDGAHLVDLSALDDHHLVLPTITRSLEIHENPGATTLTSLAQHLRDRHMLLILDNFERVLQAAPPLGELLNACPDLVVLVTSRASLRLRGEHEFSVPPLGVPDLQHLPKDADVEHFEAVALFIERARSAAFDFEPGPQETRTIAEICRELDGLPLAIELAAVRVRLLPVRDLLERLSRRLDLLKGGAQDLPVRQQTLRGLIDWDYELLDVEQQALFRRLSVCAGGFTLAAAATVADIDDMEALEGVESLLDKSLLRRAGAGDGEPRFRMLGTIREYAAEALVAAGESEDTRRRHALFYLALAEEARSHFRSSDQIEWARVVDLELDNTRAALQWAHEQADPEVELRLTGALAMLWAFRGHVSEGRRWVESALGRSTGEPTLLRAVVLRGAATLARARGSYEQAKALLEECLALQRKLGDEGGIAVVLKDLANIHSDEGDIASARSLYESSLSYWYKLAQPVGIHMTLNNLGYLAQVEGHVDEAIERFQEALVIARSIDDKQGIARLLMNLGAATAEKGDTARAQQLLEESLLLWRRLGDKWDVADTLEELAAVHCAQGKASSAATIFGAAEALREVIGARRSPLETETYEKRMTDLRARLDETSFGAAWSDGRDMEMDDAVDFALGVRKWPE
jgi:predicted ATPase/class 3 adenylate cyclase/Tfp pilus assembly protein PilF